MRRTQAVLVALSYASTLTLVGQWRVWETLHGYMFAYLLIGVIIFAVALGVAISSSWPTSSSDSSLDVAAGWLALGVAALLSWEAWSSSASVVAIVGLIILASLAFIPLGILASTASARRSSAALVVIASVAGLLSANGLFNRLHGPVEATWIAAFTLAGIAVAIARRWERTAIGLAGGAALLLAGQTSGWNPNILPRLSPGKAASSPLVRSLGIEIGGRLVGSAWFGVGRSDLVQLPASNNFYWLYSDGSMPVAVPTQAVSHSPVPWWSQHASLASLSLRAAPAGKALWIGPAPGATAWVARAMNRPLKYLAYNRSAQVMFRSPSVNPAAPANLATPVRYGSVGRLLGSLEGKYGLIGLSATGPYQAGGMGPAYALSGDLITVGAIRHYWSYLAPGGILAIVCQNEPLFARLALNARAGTGGSVGSGSFLQRAWGYKATAAYQVPSRYLLMIEKPGGGDVAATRVRKAANGLQLDELFGPDTKPVGPYGALAMPTVAQAHAALQDYLSHQVGRWISIGSTTGQRPFFMQFSLGAPAVARWVLGFAVAGLLAVLMLPLPQVRKITENDSRSQPLVPLYLVHFALVGAGFALSALYLLRLSGFVLGNAHLANVVALAALVVGSVLLNPFSRSAGAAVSLLLFALIAASGFLLDGVVGANLLPGIALAVGGGVLLGFTQAATLAAGLDALGGLGELAALSRWAWLAYGSAGLGAAAVGPWTAVSIGWWAEGLIGAGSILLSVGSVRFMRQSGTVPRQISLDVA